MSYFFLLNTFWPKISVLCSPNIISLGIIVKSPLQEMFCKTKVSWIIPIWDALFDFVEKTACFLSIWKNIGDIYRHCMIGLGFTQCCSKGCSFLCSRIIISFLQMGVVPWLFLHDWCLLGEKRKYHISTQWFFFYKNTILKYVCL